MKTFASTLTLMLIAGSAFAQSGSDAPSFTQIDANADGRISTEEARADARVAERFQDADTDRDGYLSLEEFSAVWR